MTLPIFLEPTHARISIPVMFAVGYALYHVWRWRAMHPKIVIEELPVPASEAVPAAATAETAAATAEKIALERVAETETAKIRRKAGRPRRGERDGQEVDAHRGSRWHARFEEAEKLAQFDREAFDGFFHNRALHKATHGRPEYYVRLAEYAWRRGAMVETHYWLSMAKFKGVVGLDEWLEHVRVRWIQKGRRQEGENVYEAFPPERMALAHQYLMLVCGFSTQVNHLYLTREAKGGSEEAQLILANLDKPS